MATAQRGLVWLGIVALVLLNWAALDDITTGNEPNFIVEYTVVSGSVLLLAAWVALRWRRKDPEERRPGVG